MSMIYRQLEMRGLTPSDIADKVPVGYLGLVASGAFMPTRDGMVTLCDVLNCTPYDLYTPRELDIACAMDGDERAKKKRDENGRIVWFGVSDELAEAVKGMGYLDVDEWLKEVSRQLICSWNFKQSCEHERTFPPCNQMI